MRNRTKSSAKLKQAHKEIRMLKEVIENLQYERKGVQESIMTFTETVINSKDNIMLSVMSQILCSEGFDMDYDKFCNYLYDNNILSENDIPNQEYINKGYFIVKRGFINTIYGIRHSEITLITTKGQLWLINKIKEEIGE